jgi:polyphosphate kinase
MIAVGNKGNMHLEVSPELILEEIQEKVIEQQKEFDRIWNEIQRELKKQKIFLINDRQLNRVQQKFITAYFNDEIRSNIVPLMIESIQGFPRLATSLFTWPVSYQKKIRASPNVLHLCRYRQGDCQGLSILPSRQNEKHIILLEDVIRFCLPHIFTFFGYDVFSAHIIKGNP